MLALPPLDLATSQALVAGSEMRMAPYAEVEGVFTPAECQQIVDLRNVLGADDAMISRENRGPKERVLSVDPELRKTVRTHILDTPAHRWIFERVSAVVHKTNESVWRFKLGFVEPLQQLSYPEGGHYVWHSDIGERGITSLRKISATILLSPPGDYEGGDLALLVGGQEVVPQRAQGKAILFPSFVNHRVTAVTRGLRHSLVVWTVGKSAFR